MQHDLDLCLAVARRAALQAGDLIREKLGGALHIRLKGQVNLVTEVDLACEEQIRRTLREAFPSHRILGEEGGEVGEAHPCLWIVDPLDGTTNFAHAYPFFCVSIGLQIDGQVAVGVVHDPTRDETFQAVRGRGAWLNDTRIHVTEEDDLVRSLLVTGFPYDLRSCPEIHLDLFREFVLQARGVRRDGAAALDMCYVACGRFDAFWELGLSPWDMAAGSLIVSEAGGRLTDFQGRPLELHRRDLVCSNGRLHDRMLEIIRPRVEAMRETPYWTG